MKKLSTVKKGLAFVVVIAVICLGFTAFTRMDKAVPAVLAAESEYQTDSSDAPVVYMTTEITPEALVKIYEQLGFEAEGNVAVKLSTGEPPNSNYLRPELIKDLVQSVDGTIVESNTAYGGRRSTTAAHWQVIKDHGFLDIAEADILDEDGSLEIPVNAENPQITENYVGAHLTNYDTLISLAHFKGHAMAGYGGAIKNMSIGIASSEGKCWIHTGGKSKTSWAGGVQDEFLEAMGDATSSVVDLFDGKVVYINVMNRLSVDCDCSGNPSEPDMHDIGILASYDPVALDQACIDLIYEQKDGDGASLVRRIEGRNGLHTLEHAEDIGLGSRSYRLVNIDADAQAVSMSYSGGTLTVEGITGEAALVHASYTDGKMTGIEILDAKTQKVATKAGDKFFLWESLSKLNPLCEPITVGEEPEAGNKTLIAYFSRTGENYSVGYIDIGNTARIAGYISENVDADVFEILAEEPYSDVYSETVARADEEKAADARPAFIGGVENMDQYDTVFIGYPIWHGTMPMILKTFLETYDLSGKMVIPFSTNEGSGWGSSLRDLQSLCPDSDILTGFSTRGQNAKNASTDVQRWLAGLGL